MNFLSKIYYQNKAVRSIYQSTAWLRKPFLTKKLEGQKKIIDNLIVLMQEDPILKVNEFDGIFCFDARSHLFERLVVHRYYEPELAHLCSSYVNPNKDVIDVGANIGLFSIMLAKKIDISHKVFAIEPTKNAASRLSRNIEMNHLTHKINVFQGVASNQSGTVEIKTIVGKEEYSSIGGISHPSVDNEQFVIEKVDSKTIDELVSINSINPGLIKVDVEGCEHFVFGGANETLKTKRPIIVSEMSNFLLNRNGSSSQEVIDLIKKHGYDIFDPLDPSAPTGSKDFGDIICFPKEMNISKESLQAISKQ
jgi:FkbM family methyltransferase